MNSRSWQRLVKRAIEVRAKQVSPQGPLTLNRPLSEATVRRYERRFRIELPAEYRWFIRTHGDGGLGPYAGLPRLREALAFATRTEGARVHRPFTHVEPWNLPQAEAIANLTPAVSARTRARVLRRWTARLRNAYSAPALLDGAMPVCDLGCGYAIWLVVTGSNAGELFYDARECAWGIEPVLVAGQRATFTSWYAAWLEQVVTPTRWWTTRRLTLHFAS